MKRIIIVLACLLAAIIVVGQMSGQDNLIARQVKAIATPEKSYLLDVKHHISETPRPAETYPFPIKIGEVGPVTSLYSGPNQYPFFCMTLDSGMGQPLVDNQKGLGVPVYDSQDGTKLVGYSKDCAAKTQLLYFLVDADNDIQPMTEEELRQAPIADDALLVRVEQGTINRYVYAIAMPISPEEIGVQNGASLWNNRLIYHFEGGSGIGFRQGRIKFHRLVNKELEQLRKGYAVVSSSGNKTSYGYNMLLAEDTARRVKTQFVTLFGEPLYTVGIGGSGGGLAQYLIGQNSQGILDGLIPLYSYPDMVSVSIYALDCDLLNNYFTFRSYNKDHWQDWHQRQNIEGLRAISGAEQKYGWLLPVNQLARGELPEFPKGNNECINGYLGLSSYIHNPRQGFIKPFFHHSVVGKVNWSYWQDMVNVYGQDEHGFGQTTWDNVGVQYGLQALLSHQISLDDFIDLNKRIGAWKAPSQMEPERMLSLGSSIPPLWLSIWGNQNITKLDGALAKRQAGSLVAMNKAYEYGQVFIGRINLPILDVRHYLEDELNMHHTSASFVSRLRILNDQKTYRNHVIWIADKHYNPTEKAYEVMDQWLTNMHKLPENLPYEDRVSIARPNVAQDTCFDQEGNIMAAGNGVFDGEWNQKEKGSCTQHYPMYSNSRIKAGAPWEGSIFKCYTIPVDVAAAQGMYGDWDVSAKMDELQQIFPDGVCDYRLGDMGRPKAL
ncbi:hypothetical protein C9I92_16690 [Photobacterium ganghwense]|uniref:DUF6351 domain-containing protein n=1 Tax=Photobacterium ganghwense TaxID=320778 RepID=A0A0J1H969_9GAMM|nr:DUF6351 family protein [Photobacterium ganghwense]KLV08230.1 hypothetical protein ABT57_15655 [Photobacterium ganghwense]PSU07360.1 hypothetical protein C9I92_16690 [Photobacterium ganghwense]QSV16096.1 hypothetical protein FH974_22950 [Photobacterium ganghwense]